MLTTKSEIRAWLEKGLAEGASHVIIVCDTFDHSDYPVYIQPGFDPRDYPMGEMQRAMECYDLALPIEDQLDEPRANHWGCAEAEERGCFRCGTAHEMKSNYCSTECADAERKPMPEQTYEELKAEEAAKEQAAIYETLEDDIMKLRSDVRAQADLLRAMDLQLLRPFLSNVLKLETLQRKYDEWCEEEDDA